MLPFYLVGNLHCLGMCGPLVLLIAEHPYRYLYFLGRLISFSLAALFASFLGSLMQKSLAAYNVSALVSFFFGALIIFFGLSMLFSFRYPGYKFLEQRTQSLSRRLSLLVGQKNPYATFLFGFFTVLLPCGQSMVVFSACALYGDIATGLFNGFAFALLTSPSLFLAMRLSRFLGYFKKRQNLCASLLAIFVGLLALCRGLADLGLINHLGYHLEEPFRVHLMLF